LRDAGKDRSRADDPWSRAGCPDDRIKAGAHLPGTLRQRCLHDVVRISGRTCWSMNNRPHDGAFR
jgi:hypothetical protein